MKIRKKGTVEDIFLWIVRVIMLVFVLASINIVSDSLLGLLLNTHNIEYYIISNRPMYSPSGFAYTDQETGRLYPGIIDINNFDQLNDTYKNKFKTFAAKFTLSSIDGSFEKTIYYDKDKYDLIEPLLWSDKYNSIEKKSYVLIKEGNRLTKAELITKLVFS